MSILHRYDVYFNCYRLATMYKFRLLSALANRFFPLDVHVLVEFLEGKLHTVTGFLFFYRIADVSVNNVNQIRYL